MTAKKFVLKILTSGEGGVGKTTLLYKYIEGKFSIETKMTIGVEFFEKILNIDDAHCILQLWDFGGQERFRFLLEDYVRGAKGALLMFDLTRPNTLNNLEEWVNLMRKYDDDLPILFIGTKKDLETQIEVGDEFILPLREQYKLFDYIKISSKTGENVNECFERIARKILENRIEK